jgi:phosphate transport system substrate-binding protein
MYKKVVGLFVVTLVICLTAIQLSFSQESKETVRVKGSESMSHLMTVYATEFSTANSKCNVVISGGQSRVGLSSLIDGTAEISMESARLSKAELDQAKAKGLNLIEAIVGWGGLVFVVNPSNPVESLTVDQIAKLLKGEYTSWKQVGGPDKPVEVVTVDEGPRSGTYKFITEEILKGNFAPGAKKLAYFRSVPPTVGETEGAIGIIRMRNLERLIDQGQEKKIKVVAIKKDDKSPAVTPQRESIDDGHYPVIRPFLIYMDSNKVNKCAADFFKFCEARNTRGK